jgi:ATP-dependent Clp protease adapter protein ClpS
MARESYVKKAWQYDPETGASGWFPVLDPETGDPVMITGEVAVDYVWGNFPLQPDDDREDSTTSFGGGSGDEGWSATSYIASDTLRTSDYVVEFNNVGGEVNVPADNHINAVTNYNGYPNYTPEAPYLDSIDQAAIPNVVGSLEAAANTALVAAGFVKGAVTTTHVGATTVNDLKVKTQTPAAATVANLGTSVALVKYAAPVVPDLAGMTEEEAEDALVAVHLTLGAVTTSGTGATSENDGTVKSQTPASGDKANTDSAVAVVLYEYAG